MGGFETDITGTQKLKTVRWIRKWDILDIFSNKCSQTSKKAQRLMKRLLGNTNPISEEERIRNKRTIEIYKNAFTCRVNGKVKIVNPSGDRDLPKEGTKVTIIRKDLVPTGKDNVFRFQYRVQEETVDKKSKR